MLSSLRLPCACLKGQPFLLQPFQHPLRHGGSGFLAQLLMKREFELES